MILVESLHSAVVSETTTHSIVDGLSLLNSCPTSQLYVTFEPAGHRVASVELLLPLATTGMSPQYTTTICNIDISVSSVSTYDQQTQKITIFLKLITYLKLQQLINSEQVTWSCDTVSLRIDVSIKQ